ncbi:MAG TPA: DUF1501 domain-containing protein [Bryobacteraceae bacterium]|nr:DUF1501 domain-containing protein [Bryobacteraceae bacterium]
MSNKDYFGFDWRGIPGTRFWRGPHLGRRVFFRHLTSAVSGYFLLPGGPMERVAHAAQAPKSTADFCIFVMMDGAPSHIDTFDLKTGPWTPEALNPQSYDGILWPQGLLPKLAEQMDAIALVRSVKPWATAHSLAQSWLQIARNPVSGQNRIAPHIGSVVSLELGSRTANQTLPGFLALNSGSGQGQGYLPAEHAPFYVSPNGAALRNTTHFDTKAIFDRRYALLLDMEQEQAGDPAFGSAAVEIGKWKEGASRLMYNADVTRVFTFDANERARYGNSSFGAACITARNLVRANMGTRFIQINVGGWDMHTNIYGGGLNASNANSLGRIFDAALGTLLADLKTEGLLDRTLVVAMGEFGRTLGNVNTASGRDHYQQQAVLMAGGGVRGGRALGATDERGGETVSPGWSRERDIRAEDIGATIYSALGIDWTTVRHDDPSGRGFEYTPNVRDDLYGPVHELWT